MCATASTPPIVQSLLLLVRLWRLIVGIVEVGHVGSPVNTFITNVSEKCIYIYISLVN